MKGGEQLYSVLYSDDGDDEVFLGCLCHFSDYLNLDFVIICITNMVYKCIIVSLRLWNSLCSLLSKLHYNAFETKKCKCKFHYKNAWKMQQGLLRWKFRDKQDNSRLCNTTMKYSLLMSLMQVNLFWSLQSKPPFHCHTQCYRGGSNKIVLVECICAYIHETLHLSVKQSCTHMEATI